jgi:hypothetical protein
MGDISGVAAKISQEGPVPSNWILLDSQSTLDVFCNANMLSNIRQVNTGMKIFSNAGVTVTNYIGDLAGYGTVWYDPNGIANILSLSRVSSANRVTFDSRNGNEFHVHGQNKDDGVVQVYRQADNGLYYMSM